VTASGLVVRGLNPGTGLPNNACYGLSILLHTVSTARQVVDGVALWLDGRDVDNARCNAHYVESTSVLDGFATGVKLNGNGNTLSGVTFNGPTSNASVYLYGDGTFGNTAIGCYFDSGVTGKIVKLEATNANHMITLYESVNTIVESKIGIVSGTPRYTIQSRGMLLLGGGTGAVFLHHGDNTSHGVDKSSGASAVVGVGSPHTIGLVGVPTQIGGGLLVAGENFSGGVAAVSDSGGASIQIADTPEAEFRVVKARGHPWPGVPSFEPVFAVDSSGRPHFSGPTTKAVGAPPIPKGFIEVMIGGKQRRLAFYDVDTEMDIDAADLKTDDNTVPATA
jgi:hypothetical protein